MILDRRHLVTSASCFYKRDSSYEESIFTSGELFFHKEYDIGMLGRWVAVPGVEYHDLVSYHGAPKYQLQSITVHPNFNTKCSLSNYDVAILRLKGDGMTVAEAQTVEIISPSYDSVQAEGSLCKVMGWGKVSDSANTLQKDLMIAAASKIKAISTCHEEFPELDERWSICSGPGVCEGDDSSPLFYGDVNTAATNGKTLLVGLASRIATVGCKDSSGFVKLSAVKDFICQQVPGAAGCPLGNPAGTLGAEATSLEAPTMCRWDAIDAHAKMMLIALGFLGPVGIGIPLITKHMTKPPKDSKAYKKNPNHYNFLTNWPRALYGHIICIMSAWVMIICAVIVVAVGVAPLNISALHGHWGHSVVGYFLVCLIFFQPLLGWFNLQYGGKNWFPEILLRLHGFVGQLFVGFAIFVQVPLGIIKIGYGLGALVLWLLYGMMLMAAYGFILGCA